MSGQNGLFQSEEEVVRKAEALLRSGELAGGEGLRHYSALLHEYKRLFRHARCLVKLGDRLQYQLTSLNENLQRNEKKLRSLAIKDPLTGVPNRRFFMDCLRQEYNRSVLRGSPLCLMLMDLDRFKHVNDTYGHAAGDKVLVEMCREVAKVVRKSDIFARLGGEEFCLLSLDTDAPSGLRLAERIRRAVAGTRVTHENSTILFTVSIGVTVKGEGSTSPESILKLADEAMYRAKRQGRDRIVFEPGREIRDMGGALGGAEEFGQ